MAVSHAIFVDAVKGAILQGNRIEGKRQPHLIAPIGVGSHCAENAVTVQPSPPDSDEH
jgi:hypothetical protein